MTKKRRKISRKTSEVSTYEDCEAESRQQSSKYDEVSADAPYLPLLPTPTSPGPPGTSGTSDTSPRGTPEAVISLPAVPKLPPHPEKKLTRRCSIRKAAGKIKMMQRVQKDKMKNVDCRTLPDLPFKEGLLSQFSSSPSPALSIHNLGSPGEREVYGGIKKMTMKVKMRFLNARLLSTAADNKPKKGQGAEDFAPKVNGMRYFGIGKTGISRAVIKFDSPPKQQPFTLCFHFPGTFLTHRYVLDMARDKITYMLGARVVAIQFIDRNVFHGTQGLDNRWLLTLNSVAARNELMRAGFNLYSRRIQLRRYDAILQDEYKEYLKYVALQKQLFQKIQDMQGKEKDGMRRLHELGVPIIKEPHPEDVTRALKDLKEMGGGGRGDTPVSLLSQLAEHDDEDEEDEKQSCHPDYAHKVTFTLTTPTPGEKSGD